MNCPACQAVLAAGDERCPACGSLVTPPNEGALAPEPAPVRQKVEPLREIPGLRRRERTWRDEVRERVRHRREQRHGSEELPLFPSGEALPAEEQEPPAPPRPVRSLDDVGSVERVALDAAADLPLRPGPEAPLHEPGMPPVQPSRDVTLGEPDSEPEPEAEWKLELPAEPGAPRALERPARPRERVLAALADLGLLAVLWTAVVYFTGRALRVELAGVLRAWPALAAFLAGLGLVYAGYFTGTTGQTPGKMALGLRVVDGAGRPPGYLVALARCALGVAGAIVLAGLAPMLFDPASRGLHDRLFRTRVVRH
jgi:uncharacterized RDD family membrane protein YckC